MRNGRFLYDGGFIAQPLDSYSEAQVYSELFGLKRAVDKWDKKKDKKPDYKDLNEFQTELLTLVENGDS